MTNIGAAFTVRFLRNGDTITITRDIVKIGIGHTASDCYFDVSIELEPMPVCELLLDDDGSLLLDDDGGRLID